VLIGRGLAPKVRERATQWARRAARVVQRFFNQKPAIFWGNSPQVCACAPSARVSGEKDGYRHAREFWDAVK